MANTADSPVATEIHPLCKSQVTFCEK